MANTPEAIRKSQRLYLMIGLILFIFTVVTVAVATIPWLDFGRRGFDGFDMTIGLVIASIKASLVAAVFMHLNHEKGLVYLLIGTGVVMGVALMVLIAWAFQDPVRFGDERKGDKFYNPGKILE